MSERVGNSNKADPRDWSPAAAWKAFPKDESRASKRKSVVAKLKTCLPPFGVGLPARSGALEEHEGQRTGLAGLATESIKDVVVYLLRRGGASLTAAQDG